MRVLVTGAAGMTGSVLLDYILENKDELGVEEVWGTHRDRSDMRNVKHIEDKVQWANMELTDAKSVYDTIDKIRPDRIFHLGAIAFVPSSWAYPDRVLQVNTIGTLHMLEAIQRFADNCIFQLAGSSEQYGKVSESELPITEDQPLRPISPYGVSKCSADLLTRQYHASYGLKTVVTRSFNHSGARRGEIYVLPQVVKQGIEISFGKREAFSLGDITARRDFTNAKDIARGYWMTDKCDWGEVYNICSEEMHSIKEVVDAVAKFCGIDDPKIEQDPTRMRPSDVSVLLGDCTKFKEKTGWEPEYNFQTTLNEIFNHWSKKYE